MDLCIYPSICGRGTMDEQLLEMIETLKREVEQLQKRVAELDYHARECCVKTSTCEVCL